MAINGSWYLDLAQNWHKRFSLNLSQKLIILCYEGIKYHEKRVVSDNTRDRSHLPSHVWATR